MNTFAQGLQGNSSRVFAGSLDSGFKVKFLCAPPQRHHGGSQWPLCAGSRQG